jgi:hypothetical protein
MIKNQIKKEKRQENAKSKNEKGPKKNLTKGNKREGTEDQISGT